MYLSITLKHVFAKYLFLQSSVIFQRRQNEIKAIKKYKIKLLTKMSIMSTVCFNLKKLIFLRNNRILTGKGISIKKKKIYIYIYDPTVFCVVDINLVLVQIYFIKNRRTSIRQKISVFSISNL